MTLPSTSPKTDAEVAVREAVAAILDTKGDDVRVRDLHAVGAFTDWFVLASGYSDRQVQAIADRVEERLRALGRRPLDIEGHAVAQWVLLDYGDLLVHVFLEERRRFYGLERLWSDAPDRTDEFLP
jgi:ribosome-associated protein